MDGFNRHSRTSDGRQSECRQCHKARHHEKRDVALEQMAAYRKANAAAIAASQRAWVAANRDRVNAYRRAYRKQNPGVGAQSAALWYEVNRDRVRARRQAWREANRERDRGYTLARIARLAGASGSHSNEDWLRQCVLWGNRCAYCMSGDALTRDHVIPLSRGGSDYIGNILPACGRCNSSKQGRTIMEWRVRQWRKGMADIAGRTTPLPSAVPAH